MLAATGMLGSGFRESSIAQAVAGGVDVIGCDAGSSDVGPTPLATGATQFSRAAVRRDLDVLLRHRARARVPLVIGSCGTAGGDLNLAWCADIVHELAREAGHRFRLATISAEQSPATLRRLRDEGRIAPLDGVGERSGGAPELSDGDLDECLHVVAMMGAEPIQVALDAGADVVLAGRCSDTAIFAGPALMHGHEPAFCWHAGKILECGAGAVTERVAPDSMLGVVDGDGFEVVPLRPDYRCTPDSVAAHTLYENADPFLLREPSGTVDTRHCRYRALTERSVRVTGTRFEPARRYTVKLEGVRRTGFSTIVPGAIRDPFILADLDSWLARLNAMLAERLESFLGDTSGMEIITRVYGRDGVMGELEPTPRFEGHEAFVLWDVIAPTQEQAHTVATSLGHMALHNPIPRWSGLISAVAFPFAPAEIDRGPVFAFSLDHVAVPHSPHELFRTIIEDV
jgi:hypothetical protein